MMRVCGAAVLLVALASAGLAAGTDAAGVQGGERSFDVAPRRSVELAAGWRTICDESGTETHAGFERVGFDDRAWRGVDVPHNWDDYHGSRQVRHGNLHGTAWYRRTFTVSTRERGRRIVLFFEGVGSYAGVWVNGRLVGRHAGGLTTFTLDVTDAVVLGADNLLAVRADHPRGIRDLPWVCGGCERAQGFSEGPQPFGIFRAVHLVTTAALRIEPFGVHAWSDVAADGASATVHVRSEVRNYGDAGRRAWLVTRIRESSGRIAGEARARLALGARATEVVAQELPGLARPRLWSPSSPHLYTVESEVVAAGSVLDRVETSFGIRTLRWPEPGGKDGRLLVNGQPVFINGVCDYEHLLGANHAFGTEQIRARVRQIEAAGFNAFRDAHHPHNLRFQEYWDRDGLLWWPQFGAHIWFDSDAFRASFRDLLRDWVKERRNSPSLVLWGLQNESQLPTAFAQECVALIRALDPTASAQRKIVTCNGGSGTDWDVPQNWSGTYGGDPLAYAGDLVRQLLVGEYGAWRSLGLHTEGGFDARGPLSEERMCALLGTKLRLAESVRDRACGHFLWPFTTHSNPGRDFGAQGEQLHDGIRPLDQVGPANNKGLFTLWGEPLDAFYLYRAHLVPASAQPMVYIASHTWPGRWTAPGRKSGIVVYSNCSEVELFNDLGSVSLGRRVREGRDGRFQWDDVEIRCNVLYAEGRLGGRVVARDQIALDHLPGPPGLEERVRVVDGPAASRPGRNYLYRVNCGGPDYRDRAGQLWLADRDYAEGDAWGSLSWASAFPNLEPQFASRRKVAAGGRAVVDEDLFRTFRYGRDRLRYRFRVPEGDYEVELYFIEPWYGVGGGIDATGWRLFDVAINGTTALRNLDLWKEGGQAQVVKRVVPARPLNGRIEISFPRVAAGQAVISAIAICSRDPSLRPPRLPAALITDLQVADRTHAARYSIHGALDAGDVAYGDAGETFAVIPRELLDSDWIQTAGASRSFDGPELLRFTVSADAEVFVAHDDGIRPRPRWLEGWEATGWAARTTADAVLSLYERSFPAGSVVVLGPNGAQSGAEGAMYGVFVKKSRPPVAAQFVRGLEVTGELPGRAWRACGHLRSGARPYSDGGPRIARLPGRLTDGDWISPPRGSPAGARARFTPSEAAEVHVALDARLATRPAWLADWVETGQKITTGCREAREYALLKRRFAPGETVTLEAGGVAGDGAQAVAPFAIVRPVRPSTRYEAEDASTAGARIVREPDGHSGAAAVEVRGGESLEWTVTVGVGDRYGLNLRYASAAQAALAAELAIIAGDGSLVRREALEFPPVSSGATWGVLRVMTGASINAGSYRLRLAPRGPSALVIDVLEVE